jgi:uncharacterized membrane protein
VTTTELVDSPDDAATVEDSKRRVRRHPRAVAVTLGLTGVLAIPLLVGLGVLHDPPWFPHGDLAVIELRVRDVLTSHPPLVGLGGRLEGYGVPGSHPGPLGFFALWPIYQAFGADGWALQVASASLGLAAAGLGLAIAYRRGSWPFAVTVACVLALLMRGYGATVLIEPWNPQLPVMWWMVFLLAVWAVLCDDLPLLPVAVVAGSLCMQTHIPYLALGSGIGAVTVGGLALMGIRRGHDRPARRRLVGWVGVSAALLVVLWLFPLIDQARHSPGNLSIIIENFRHPYDEQVSFGSAVKMFFAHLNVWELLNTHRAPTGPPLPGVALLAIWSGTAALALRRRESALVRLHTVVGSAAALGLLAMSRIFGHPWHYLMLWAWGTTALMVLAAVWTLLSLPGARPPSPQAAPLSVPPLWRPLPTTALLGAAALTLTTLFAIDAASTEMPNHQVSDNIRRMISATMSVLETDPANCGDDCRYVVTSDDPWSFEDAGVILGLERLGIDASAVPVRARLVRPHRVIDLDEADARIHIAVGDTAIAAASQQPRARQLTRVGLSAQQQADYRQLRRYIIDRLEAAGLHHLAAQVELQEIIRADPSMPDDVVWVINQANAFPRPRAVFLILPDDTR